MKRRSSSMSIFLIPGNSTNMASIIVDGLNWNSSGEHARAIVYRILTLTFILNSDTELACFCSALDTKRRDESGYVSISEFQRSVRQVVD